MERLSTILKSAHTSNEKPLTPEERKKWIFEYETEKVKFYNDTVGTLQEKDGYNCDKCRNKGGIMVLRECGNSYEQVYRQCECMKVRSMIMKIQRSGLKNIMNEYTFEKYTAKENWQKSLKLKAKSFLEDETSEWFYIGGQSGAGKTHLCTAITVTYLNQNKAARYMLWRDDVTKIKAVVNDNEEYHKLVNELKTIPVLYIDDLFKMGKNNHGTPQPPTVADINLAYEIINYRYNNKGLITIISSEYTIGEIVKIDEALGGRISEKTAANGYCINLSKDVKKNYRLQGIIEM